MLKLIPQVRRSWLLDKGRVIAWHYARQLPIPFVPDSLRVRMRPPVRNETYQLQLETPVDTLRAVSIFSEANPWAHLDLRPSPQLIIDLGANNGFSTLYWKTRFPAATVSGVEMDEPNLSRCRALFSGNGLEQSFFHCAIGSRDEPVSYRRHEEGGRHRLTELCDERFAWQERGIEVPGWTFETFLDRYEFGYVDILKVDIEGAEQFLLETLPRWSQRVRQIILELHHNVNLAWARERLRLAGFGIVSSDVQTRTEWFCVNRSV
jgi:FkbM family methyltransferase